MVEPFEKPVLFVKGADSDYILPQHRARIIAFFPQASVKVMSGCGHWLHAQKPRLFNSIARRFFVAVYTWRLKNNRLHRVVGLPVVLYCDIAFTATIHH